ncbi:MAG: CRISPR-associated protein Cas4 [Nitrospinaceae bacterium]
MQHLAFCERQWALIHLEQQWRENSLTLKGRFLHERVDVPATAGHGGLRLAVALPLRSLRLGLVGKADKVEFHRLPETRDPPIPEAGPPPGVALPGISGLWAPVPVEYKHGRPKKGGWDRVQVCAQALCLEEMLNVAIPRGWLFYGRTRRRHEVPLTPGLREETEALTARLHQLSKAGRTPPPRVGPHCESCSLRETCLPRVTEAPGRAQRYLEKNLAQPGLAMEEEPS